MNQEKQIGLMLQGYIDGHDDWLPVEYYLDNKGWAWTIEIVLITDNFKVDYTNAYTDQKRNRFGFVCPSEPKVWWDAASGLSAYTGNYCCNATLFGLTTGNYCRLNKFKKPCDDFTFLDGWIMGKFDQKCSQPGVWLGEWWLDYDSKYCCVDYRHGGAANVLFLDGHASSYRLQKYLPVASKTLDGNLVWWE